MGAAVEIAVLGPVEVRGRARPFRRAAGLELAVYLAFHRSGVRNTEWPLALWPDRAVAQATVHSTVSDARHALGRGAHGQDHLPRGPRLRLGHGVTTDVDRFAALAESDDARELSRALELVRGPAFGGLRRSDWAVVDGTLAGIESMIVAAARRAAAGHLCGRRVTEAERAVRAGLAACPYDERLYRTLLQVTAAGGNRVGLRGTMTELLLRAADGPLRPGPPRRPSPVQPGALHPETLALYRELSG